MDEQRLAAIPLFASLSKKERKRVAQVADEVDVSEGRQLVTEGDFAYEFFAIEEGSAEVTHGDEVLKELGPGDFFGEIGSVERSQRNASIVATSPMTTIVIPSRDLRQLAREMPEVGQKLRSAIEERRRELVVPE